MFYRSCVADGLLLRHREADERATEEDHQGKQKQAGVDPEQTDSRDATR